MSDVNLGLDPLRSNRVIDRQVTTEESASAVSWAAILAGAAGAAALSLLLMILGTGLGFSAVSPWRMEGISATTFGVAAIAWLSFTQLAASGMGGYLAGRLRTKWMDVHTDEVYFRDTAHGFLTWAVASLLTAVVMTSVISSLGSGVRSGAQVVGEVTGAATSTVMGSAAMLASGDANSDEPNNSLGYFVDSLFRDDGSSDKSSSDEPATPAASQPAAEMTAGRETPPVSEQMPQTSAAISSNSSANNSPMPVHEVTRILAQGLYAGSLPQDDQRYVAQLIAQHTELSQQQAEQRVAEGFSKVQTMLQNAENTAREAADEARKASAYAALWMSIALLFGAFIASLMAVYGGRQRDA